ncbi:FMN-dependent NADH-azoreductase [Sphingomonas sp. ac-8]|uniref:FMN-dependent NADH-azoreductase n=1 Tax=Sphingomonas sp. ac-8 TaxID=3242977 RepID=UPI003A8139ED
MLRILALSSSPRPPEVSISRRLSTELIVQIARAHPGAAVIQRDLAAEAPPHVGAALLAGVRKPELDRSAEEAAAVAISAEMIEQLVWADVLVIGAPMYNFGFPSVLKTWIDNVSVPGRTFRYDRDGNAHGLVTGKRAYVVTSRGGDYGTTGAEAGNFADSHARVALALLGIVDLHVVAADWQALHPEARRDGYDVASRRISELVPA